MLDVLTYAGNIASLQSVSGHEQYRFVKGDIVDRDFVAALLREEQVDTIVHFAAESHVDRSVLRPAAFIDTNIIGTHNLLQAARNYWLDSDDAPVKHRFHHVSTDEVYGSLGPSDPGFSELTPYAPNSPYSASKAASDHLVRAYHHTYGLQVTTSNCSNNYGPYQFPEIGTEDYPTAARRPQYSVLDCSATCAALNLHPAQWRANLRRMLKGMTT